MNGNRFAVREHGRQHNGSVGIDMEARNGEHSGAGQLFCRDKRRARTRRQRQQVGSVQRQDLHIRAGLELVDV